jgi:uncharacterized SAM-dependent methyltransferase
MVKSQKTNFRENSPKINDLIFKELTKRGYSLEGKSKVWNISDSRFWYVTPEQSRAFLDLEKKDPKQKMFVKQETGLIKKHCKELTLGIDNKGINIIDLGCGDGTKAMKFINCFKNKEQVRYCPLDVSSFMVESAIKNVSKLKKVSIINKNNVRDFLHFGDVSDSLRKNKFKSNYILLLGGSLENSEAHELFHEIRASMKDGDYLLIGNKLTHPNPEKMVNYYLNTKKIDEMLVKTLELLGFNKNEIQYGARFRGSRIEMLYTLRQDRTLISKGKKIELKAGDSIIVAISYKYTKDSLLELLMMYFDNIETFVSNDGIYALALCKK